MLALRYIKSIPRYLMVRSLSPLWSEVSTSPFSCLQLIDMPPPELPAPDWVQVQPRLSGICGSDLSLLQAKGSTYFTPFVSTPFVVGHEVVGTVSAIGTAIAGVKVGDRVVVEPNLSCRVRGVTPICRACEAGHTGNCENVACGCLGAGIQTGFCASTGGGWSSALVAHQSQIHIVPDSLSDETAVLIEPFSCALHSVLQADLSQVKTGLVIGCGVIGLLTIAALRSIGYEGHLIAIARYPHQAEMAELLGADQILSGGKDLYDKICQITGAKPYQPELGKPVLLGGVDCTFDCVASSKTLDDALRLTRARGQVVLVGMPSIPKGIDWTTIWHQELQVIGTYTYGTETYEGQVISTFDLAIRLLEKYGDRIQNLVTGLYRLTDYQTALQVAMNPKRSKAIKTVFDLRT
jgi:threonine dehydrogenase-like Zn-dependent dehydrogenase